MADGNDPDKRSRLKEADVITAESSEAGSALSLRLCSDFEFIVVEFVSFALDCQGMKASDFLKTRWGQLARTAEGEQKVRKEFNRWLAKTKDSALAKRARQLWTHLNSGSVSKTEKVLIIAALLYLITPVDFVPDWIPVAGLLDDAGIAALVLDYVMKRVGDTHDGDEKAARPRRKVGPILKAVAKAMK
jgi:uncharacterized membrane protein YkvA (DUF1232 family)